jgi:hypothetical protein
MRNSFKVHSYLRTRIYKRFRYINDKSLKYLSATCSHQLVWLEVVDCPSVTDEGLESLKRISSLKMLHIGNLKYVKDPLKVISTLKEAMPNCIIKYPPHTDNSEVEGTEE